MGIALDNGKLTLAGGSNAPLTQKIKPMAPSFAEQAVFIAKPYKRVEFQLQMPDQQQASGNSNMGAANGTTQPTPAANAPKVVMQVDPNPQKDVNAFGVQQEGRQINHDSTVYFLQQYDSYGRPRMGMSREPYDFAFTKFMVKTNQIKFQENMNTSNSDVRKKVEAYVNSAPAQIQASNNSDMSVKQNNPPSSTTDSGATPVTDQPASFSAVA